MKRSFSETSIIFSEKCLFEGIAVIVEFADKCELNELLAVTRKRQYSFPASLPVMSEKKRRNSKINFDYFAEQPTAASWTEGNSLQMKAKSMRFEEFKAATSYLFD